MNLKKKDFMRLMVYCFTPSNKETEAGGVLWVQDYPDLKKKF